MPKDDKGRIWPLERKGVFSNGVLYYKPPPDYDDDPPPPMGASQKAIDDWDKKHRR